MAVPLLAGGFLLSIAVPLVVKVLLALGVGFAVYTGADVVFTEAETFINAELAGLPADLYAIFQLMGVMQGLSILFAAYASATAIKVALGAFSKVTFTAPSA